MKIGLIGNPNVGKSTIFNALTGMHQHTGNWPGKTVEKASGFKIYNGVKYVFDDLPGTYSLGALSKEEEVTRDYIYFSNYDALVIVCDACCLERNLNLVLQVLEVTNKVVLCINLVDEAKKKEIIIDYDLLSNYLGVPVIPTVARSKKGINKIFDSLNDICTYKNKPIKIDYDFLEDEFSNLYDLLPNTPIEKSIICFHLIMNDYDFINSFDYKYKTNINRNIYIKKEINTILERLYKRGFNRDDILTISREAVSLKSEEISKSVISYGNKSYDKKDRIIDRVVTGKFSGTVIMIFALFVVLWITIVGANYPSDFLYNLLFKFEKSIINCLNFIHLPSIFINIIVYGVYRVLAWVVAVMLPPMAIFFPLFTLLEDFGYLPRVAFSLDNSFKKCSSCGKQALTMMEGFGCNAVGVTGARIIDSPRERLISIITNSLVPCNGRFPLIITLISLFLVTNKFFGSFVLLMFILLSVLITFITSKILSKTILKGEASSFMLELPPYRRPLIGKVIIRSIFDKTWTVLKRALVVSAPAGLIIWCFANIKIGNITLLQTFTNFLDPFGKIIGLDGVILMAFILGFPANEIVIPIMILGYMSLGYITDINDLKLLKNLFVNNGWTYVTAINTIIFSLFHFPCMTTLLTIKKETGSFKWTILSFIVPLIIGTLLCFLVNFIF